MSQQLLDAASRYTERNADRSGLARTPIPGLTLVRTTRVGEPKYAVHRPLLCLVIQGAKEVTVGAITKRFGAGDTMLVNSDLPAISRITMARSAAPYLSFAIHLDPALILALSPQMEPPADHEGTAAHFDVDTEVIDTACRMVRLLGRPACLPLLQQQLVREMHVWLLAGRHGPALRRLGSPHAHSTRIARAVQLIRAEFALPLSVEQLASEAAMSPSSFHHHFRAVTSLSPLQFQKQLRLIEARRLMLANGLAPSNAAYAVGYASVAQFTREYGRLFGLPPLRDTEAARRRHLEIASSKAAVAKSLA